MPGVAGDAQDAGSGRLAVVGEPDPVFGASCTSGLFIAALDEDLKDRWVTVGA